jgi:predicted DNA-binding protein YlxM (UPF0122 family)
MLGCLFEIVIILIKKNQNNYESKLKLIKFWKIKLEIRKEMENKKKDRWKKRRKKKEEATSVS